MKHYERTTQRSDVFRQLRRTLDPRFQTGDSLAHIRYAIGEGAHEYMDTVMRLERPQDYRNNDRDHEPLAELADWYEQSLTTYFVLTDERNANPPILHQWDDRIGIWLNALVTQLMALQHIMNSEPTTARRFMDVSISGIERLAAEHHDTSPDELLAIAIDKLKSKHGRSCHADECNEMADVEHNGMLLCNAHYEEVAR